jgi:putative transposase
VPVLRPRVRQAGKELVLQTYAAYQDAEMLSEATLHACILGVATRGYRQDQAAHATLPEGVPVLAASRSTVSRRFARDTQALLEEQLARPLQGERYLALFLDGVQWGAHQILVALGLTAAGEKQVLGLREGDSENSAVCGALLEDLVARGLSTESGLLAVVDGGKGWAAGIARVFGARVLVQRCVVHKARNVMDKLPQTAQRRVKRALATAWTDPNPTRAEQRLRRLADALQQEGYGEAAASLREGLEDTLTHLRLQVPPALARSLRSTNAIESMFSHHRRITGGSVAGGTASRRSVGPPQHSWRLSSACGGCREAATCRRSRRPWSTTPGRAAGWPSAPEPTPTGRTVARPWRSIAWPLVCHRSVPGDHPCCPGTARCS